MQSGYRSIDGKQSDGECHFEAIESALLFVGSDGDNAPVPVEKFERKFDGPMLTLVSVV